MSIQKDMPFILTIRPKRRLSKTPKGEGGFVKPPSSNPNTRRRKPTQEQVEALRSFARANGRLWKQALRDAWMRAGEPGPLQALRNSHGPSWLASFRLPAGEIKCG